MWWWPSWIFNQNKKHAFCCRGLPKKHTSKFCFQMIQWFQRWVLNNVPLQNICFYAKLKSKMVANVGTYGKINKYLFSEMRNLIESNLWMNIDRLITYKVWFFWSWPPFSQPCCLYLYCFRHGTLFATKLFRVILLSPWSLPFVSFRLYNQTINNTRILYLHELEIKVKHRS
jgi:hypothetical protein